MLRSVTAKKIEIFIDQVDRGSRKVAAALLTNRRLSRSDYRTMLAATKTSLSEIGDIYNALKGKVGSVRGLVAASRSADYEEAMAKVVTMAARLDLLRHALAEELGESPEAPIEEVAPEDATSESIVGDLEGDVREEEAQLEGNPETDDPLAGDDAIDAGDPVEVDPEQPNVEEDEEEYEDGGDDEDLPEMGEGDEGEDGVVFNEDGGEEEAPPPAVETTSSRKRRVQTARRNRKSITARRSTKGGNAGVNLSNLWNFIGN